jgi:hypothetical protein
MHDIDWALIVRYSRWRRWWGSVCAGSSSRPGKRAPIFEVDPFWQKPLPNHWVTSSTIGLSVDARDNICDPSSNTVEDNFKAADILRRVKRETMRRSPRRLMGLHWAMGPMG